MQFSKQHLLALLGLQSLAFAKAPTATIEGGSIIGTSTVLPSSQVTVNKFLGIPFASPPGRFEAPTPPKPWSGALNATNPPPSCIQAFICMVSIYMSYLKSLTCIDPQVFHDFLKDYFNAGNPPESEDCLYVNVFAPSTPP